MKRTHALAWLPLLGACASTHTVESPHAINRPWAVLAEAPPSRRPQPGAKQLLVRYLRAGGVYFEWQGQALMTAPFMSNYPLVSASREASRHRFEPGVALEILPKQKLVPNVAAIDHVLADVPLERVYAILSGHSHYDHLGDVPAIAARASAARLFVNDSGAKILAAAPELRGRVESVEDHRGPICIADPCLVRFWVMPSEHAPNLRLAGVKVHWAPGEVPAPLAPPFSSHELLELQEGHPLAFVLDFMDPTNLSRVAYRVHYQDAASRPPAGFPAPFILAERAVDLEVVTMPGREALPKSDVAYPVGLLRYTGARHALVIHYEDFFLPVLKPNGSPAPVRILPTLAGSPATELLDSIHKAVERPERGACKLGSGQGLCGAAFTLPLPGEWLLFDAPPH